MKKLLATTVGLLVCGSAFANPPDIGQTVVTFNSHVNATSCAVNSTTQEVSLPSTILSELNKGSATTTNATSFDVELKNCPTGGYKKANGSPYDINVYITDATNVGNENIKGLLTNTGVSDAATHVFVQLLDKNDGLLNISNDPNAAPSLTILGNETESPVGNVIKLPLKARLYADSSVEPATAGKVQAKAAITFEYK